MVMENTGLFLSSCVCAVLKSNSVAVIGSSFISDLVTATDKLCDMRDLVW